jgi:hypothetical protein
VSETDPAINPDHYMPASHYEPIKVMEAWFGREAVITFCQLTAAKYLARAGKKAGESMLRDFKKARWYLDHAITLMDQVNTNAFGSTK